MTIILKEERGGKTDHQIEQEWKVDTVAERATFTQRPKWNDVRAMIEAKLPGRCPHKGQRSRKSTRLEDWILTKLSSLRVFID